MAQSTESSQNRLQRWDRKSPANVALPSSKGSSFVSTRRPSPPLDSIETDLPVVAINYSGTTPTLTLSQQPLPPLKPSVLTSNLDPHATAQDLVFEKSVLIGLEFGMNLEIGISGSNLGVKAQWQRRASGEQEENEDGSDLALVNVSPIYATSSMTSPTEEQFVNATAHLRQYSHPATRQEILEARNTRAEKARREKEEPERKMRKSMERESSEEVLVVPALRPGNESAAEARRRRRRLERRQTPMVSPTPVQRQWERRMY